MLTGAIKDSVVGEEAIVKYYLNLLASNPKHLAAMKASQAPGYKSPSSNRGSSGSSGTTGASSPSKQLTSVREALVAAAEYTGRVSVSVSTRGIEYDTCSQCASGQAVRLHNLAGHPWVCRSCQAVIFAPSAGHLIQPALLLSGRPLQ